MNVNFWLDLLVLTLLWAGIGGAWNLLAGYGGQFSLGHAAFVGIGAYTSTLMWLQLGVWPWLGMLSGAALAALLAVGIGAVSLHARGPFFTLISIAFAEVLRILATHLDHLTHGARGLSIPFRPSVAAMIFRDKQTWVLLTLAFASLVFALCVIVRRMPLGYRLLAFREEEDAARSLGVPTLTARLQALALSAALTAVGGSLYAQYTLFIDPESTMSFLVSVQPALVTIVGGLGQAFGPLLGAVLVVPLESLLRAWFGGQLAGLHGFLYGALLIVVLLVAPRGLLPHAAALVKGRREQEQRAAPART
jgi:branched-chain amino acid transport system permease protein